MFSLDLLPRFELEEYFNDEGRVYRTPLGDFPSVTTILGKAFDKSHLEEWKARLGEEEALKQTTRASLAGTELHNILEKYLLNEDYSRESSLTRMRFEAVKRKITPHIDKVYGAEFPLYSSALQTAGRTDGIVRWDGEDAILDLKTTKNFKREDWILNYFVQAATYGSMLRESLLPIQKIVIVFSTEDFQCYYFEKNISDYLNEVRRIFIDNR